MDAENPIVLVALVPRSQRRDLGHPTKLFEEPFSGSGSNDDRDGSNSGGSGDGVRS